MSFSIATRWLRRPLIGAALLARDLGAFDRLYQSSVDRANELHIVTGYPYIRWSRPEQPPDPGLDLGPGE